MPAFPGFCGSSSTVSSKNVNAERTRNWYVEHAPGSPKGEASLMPTPGIEPFVVLGVGPVRGMFGQDGRAFAAGGTGFFEFFATHTFFLHGTILTDNQPVTIDTNGTAGGQLLIVSRETGYVFDLTTDTLSVITDMEFPLPVAMGGFVDGYGLALKAGTNQFQWSALEDFTSWDGLDVAQVSQTTGNLIAMAVVKRDIWLWGESNATVWQDTGDSLNPFEPIPGAYIQQGIAGRFCWTVADNTVFWLGQSEQGRGMVFRANGYTPQRVSDYAVEYALSQYPQLSDVIFWSYEERGHTFVMMYLPTAPLPTNPNNLVQHTTWCYDVAENAWHERSFDDVPMLREVPHVGRCQTFAFGQNLIGDRQSAAIYRYSSDINQSIVVQMGA